MKIGNQAGRYLVGQKRSWGDGRLINGPDKDLPRWSKGREGSSPRSTENEDIKRETTQRRMKNRDPSKIVKKKI